MFDSIPIMNNATDIETDIRLYASGDSDPYAIRQYRVRASWREIISFYEKELLERDWQELAYRNTKVEILHSRYMFNRSWLLKVWTNFGGMDQPDLVTDYEVLLALEWFPPLAEGVDLPGYRIYVPQSPGSLNDALWSRKYTD